jgi:hypothetical protein
LQSAFSCWELEHFERKARHRRHPDLRVTQKAIWAALAVRSVTVWNCWALKDCTREK